MSEIQVLRDADKKLVDTAYDRLRLFYDANRAYHDAMREARAIVLLQDPGQDPPGTTEPTIQLQTLKSTFNCCVADQMDNMPEPTMVPERADLEAVAEDLTDTVRFVLHLNDYESIHRRRVEDFFCGTAVTQVVWDPDMDNGRGNVALIRYPLEAFLWDPLAEDIQDARALFKVAWRPREWFEEHYPDKAKYIGDESGMWETLAKAPAAESAQDGEKDTVMSMLLEYWWRTYDAKARRYNVSVAYLAGGALLEKKEKIYKHGMYPFVLDVFTPIEGVPVGEGMVRELAPMARYVNRYARYIDTNLRMMSRPRMLVRRDSDVNREALADWNNQIIEITEPEAVQWQQMTPFNGMAQNVMAQFQADIKQDSGQNQFTRGETAGGVTAASAISALQEAGGKITRLRTAVLNQGFKRICELVMWLMAQFYDDQRVMMITGPDGTRREVDMSSAHLFAHGERNALPPPPYTVQVQISRRNPLRVQAQNELFMQAYAMAAQSGAPFPLVVLFELLQVDGKDRIMPVLREYDQMQQQMQQMAQQNEQLQQQAQVQAEENDALKRVNEQVAGAVGGTDLGAQETSAYMQTIGK